MRTVKILSLTFLAVVLLATGPASAQGAKFLKRFKDWSAYVFDTPGKKICFAVTQPKDFEPKSVERGDIYFYVSSWPGDGVSHEVSVKVGYNFDKGSTATAAIGSDLFELFTEGDKAFVESPNLEKRLVAAMRRGSKMVVKGRSGRGTATTDVYSLSGITAALKFTAAQCN